MSVIASSASSGAPASGPARPMAAPGAARHLRILHVVPTYFPAVRYGGPVRSVHGLAAALVRRGHEVHVYTTNVDGPDNLDVPRGKPVNLDGVWVHYFPVPALRRLYWAPQLANALKSTVSGFDVVHLHSIFLWPTWAAARAAARAGVPYITAPRGMLVKEMIRRKNAWVKHGWIKLIERSTFVRAAGVHVTAQIEADELRAFGWPLHEITHIPNGVEIPTRHPVRSAGPYGHLPARYALFLSRISWKKGLDRLITAWQWVPDIPLVIAGNDDEGYRSRLEAQARQLGLESRVLFIGPVSDQDKWALYAEARLFVLPSYSENFGNVVAEAMAVGCPVLVSAEVGIAALVAEAGAGKVVDCEPRKLAEAVREMLSQDSLRAEMGARGREMVRARLSWDGIAGQAEKLYYRVSRDDPAVMAT